MISCFSSRIPPVKMSKAHSRRSIYPASPNEIYVIFTCIPQSRSQNMRLGYKFMRKRPKAYLIKYRRRKSYLQLEIPTTLASKAATETRKCLRGFKTDRLWKTKRLSISWKDTINAKKLYRPSTVSHSCLQGSKSSVQQRSFANTSRFYPTG